MKKNKFPYAFFVLCFTWLVLMILVVPVDYDWTIGLRKHRIRQIDNLMDHTLFEGEAPGGGDPVILFLIVVTGAYYLAWKKGISSRFYVWRPCLGFILTSALICSVMMIHSLKWVMGRTRPLEVVKGHLPFSDWFVFGPHFITEGIYRGSFPSGHAAQVFILMTVAYILAGNANRSFSVRLSGWLWGCICFLYTAVMGISRCMTLSHWLTDVMGAIGIAWLLMHLIYYRILKVPEQAAYYKKFNKFPAAPVVWELRLCAHIFGIILGGAAFFLGIRAVLLQEAWLLYFLIPIGMAMIILFFRHAKLLYRRVATGFNDGAQIPSIAK